MSDRYAVERLPNGLTRVFDRASKLSACYRADGTYAHGDLRAATLDALLETDERTGVLHTPRRIPPRIQREQLQIEERIPQ